MPIPKTIDLDELLLWGSGANGDIPVWNGTAFVPSVLTYVEAAQDEFVVNEAGADVDFRVEAVGQPNAWVVRGSDGNIGVRTATPIQALQVDGILAVGGDATSGVAMRRSGSIGEILGITPPFSGYNDLAIRAHSSTQLYLQSVLPANVGLGTSNPTTFFDILLTNTLTATTTPAVTIGRTSSGTPDAGFGGGVALQLKSSTTVGRDAAALEWLWNTATDATRKADLVLSAYDTAKREGVRIRGNGSEPALGLLGATPVVRQAHLADPSGGAVQDAEARTALNSILDVLESFGLVATS